MNYIPTADTICTAGYRSGHTWQTNATVGLWQMDRAEVLPYHTTSFSQ